MYDCACNYASQLGSKWDWTPADMQGHGVPEVVTVNKVYRMCPVVAMEISIPNGL